MNIPLIILSAGSSSRLGARKQLLPYKEKTLILHVIDQCILSKSSSVAVVLGCDFETIKDHISDRDIGILINEDWSQGMSTSIVKAMRSIEDDADGVIIALSDQPHLNSDAVDALVERANEDHVVVSKYSEGYGPPVFFPQRYFSKLLSLKGDQGAKDFLKELENEVVFVSFEKGHIDIDYPADIIHLSKD